MTAHILIRLSAGLIGCMAVLYSAYGYRWSLALMIVATVVMFAVIADEGDEETT